MRALCQPLLKEIHPSSYLVSIHPDTLPEAFSLCCPTPNLPQNFPSGLLSVTSWVCELDISFLLAGMKLGSTRLSCPPGMAPRLSCKCGLVPRVKPALDFMAFNPFGSTKCSEKTRLPVRNEPKLVSGFHHEPCDNRHQPTCTNTSTTTDDFKKINIQYRFVREGRLLFLNLEAANENLSSFAHGSTAPG